MGMPMLGAGEFPDTRSECGNPDPRDLVTALRAQHATGRFPGLRPHPTAGAPNARAFADIVRAQASALARNPPAPGLPLTFLPPKGIDPVYIRKNKLNQLFL